MKIEIIIDESLDESLIKIYTPSYNKDIENLQKSLENVNNNVLVGFLDYDVYLLEYKDIIRCITKDKSVYIDTLDKSYKSRLRLYEIENRLDKNKFIKISRYEIINIDYVKKLDLSFRGTIAIEFKNGNISYVSRRFLSEFRKNLGIWGGLWKIQKKFWLTF